VGSEILHKPVPTIVGEEIHLHFNVADLSEDEKYRIGDEVRKARAVRNPVKPFIHGKIVNEEHFVRLCMWVYGVGFGLNGKTAPNIEGTLSGALPRPKSEFELKPTEHPVLIAEPTMGFSEQEKKILKDIFF